MRSPEKAIFELLAKAGITVNGCNPWDPQVRDERVYVRIIAHGSLGLGESYMDGWWTCRDIAEMIGRILHAEVRKQFRVTRDTLWLGIKARVSNRQNIKRSKYVGKVHYDLGPVLHDTYCDSRTTGSCGYWSGSPPAQNIEEAQIAKLDLVFRKIGLKRGQRLYDVGCGWGAAMERAAEHYGAECEGVSISQEQVAYVKKMYEGRLPVKAHFLDYRVFQPEKPFDHVVSMGMFEHVGTKNYREYFECVRRALKESGHFLLHTIVGNKRSPIAEPFVDEYIFPGGVIPTLGEITSAIEGIFVPEDVHILGGDYDKTLCAWNENFQKHRVRYAADPRYGERFCRMWEYYLLSCAGGFRARNISVAQIVMSPRGVPGGYRTVR